jgi:hypothetical protein
MARAALPAEQHAVLAANQPHKITAKGIDYRPDIDGLRAVAPALQRRSASHPRRRHVMAAIFDPIFASRVVSDHPVAQAP